MSANELTLTELTLTELTQKLDAKEVSACEAARVYLDRIASADPDIGAYLTVTEDIALKAAAASDKRRGENAALSPLDGVPMAVKDAVCVNGVRTTAASKMLENYIPPYSATVYSRLSGAGAVLLGKCNMDEFAMGVSGETSYFYPVKNPFDPQRTAGGSSSGSAAAVAADMTAFALGTDSGGSVRGPAAFCGVIGLKPTFGLISRYGVIPYASSLDAVGILSKTVADCAAVLSSAAGYDPLDTLSAKSDIRDFAAETGESAAGLRIGVPKEYLGEGIAPDIRDMVIKAADKLRSLGAAVKETSLPRAKYALAAYYVLGTAEAGSNMARYDGLRYGFQAERPSLRETYRATRAEGFGDEVKRRIILGTFVLSSENYADYYEKARKVRALIIEDFKRAFADFDILLTPTAAGPAFKLGEDNPDRYMADICTVSANMAGIPALSVPAGLSEGMPVALQLMGPAFSEKRLFRVAGLLEGPRLRPGA